MTPQTKLREHRFSKDDPPVMDPEVSSRSQRFAKKQYQKPIEFSAHTSAVL
jgi:hypothetical protein